MSTSVSGNTGAPSAPAATTPTSAVVDWFNPKAFGAKGDGKNDDTAAVQQALDACKAAGGGTVYLPTGGFNITKPLTWHSHVNVQGSNSYAAILNYLGDPGQSWIQGVDIEHVAMRDFGVNGPSWGVPPTGAGHGFDFTRSANPDTHFVTFENVHVQNCGGSAFRISNPMVTTFTRSVATNCGRGFELYGIPNGAAGTSVFMAACYANGCMHEGYAVSKMVYTAMAACAADHNAVGYSLSNCDGVVLNGCGAEVTAAKNGLDGTSFLVDDCRGVTVLSPFTWSNAGDAIRVQNASQNITVTGAVENQPVASATASIRVQPGSSVELNSNTGVSPEMLINE